MSGIGNATVTVTSRGEVLANRYRTRTCLAEMKRSSARISIAAFLVNTSPPAASSAVESLAAAPALQSNAAPQMAPPVAFKLVRIGPSPLLGRGEDLTVI